MQREVIKPQADVPVTVRLDQGPEGQEREGRYGIDYQYTVNNDRGVMWLPKEARDQLVRCGAQAGDEIQIVKSLRGRIAQWAVQVVPDSNELAPPPRSNGYINGNGNGNGNGHYAGQAQPPRPDRYGPSERPASIGPMGPEATNVSPVTQQLAGCLRAAVDACFETETYAKTKGMPLEFCSEDIRAIALSVYIGAQRNGGSR